MHEIGIVDDVLFVINAKLKEHVESSKVKRVNLIIGELEHISLEHFEFHFRERTKGTDLENAKLDFKRVKAKFKCKNCGFVFSASGDIECPMCNSRVSEVMEGNRIYVESVEVI